MRRQGHLRPVRPTGVHAAAIATVAIGTVAIGTVAIGTVLAALAAAVLAGCDGKPPVAAPRCASPPEAVLPDTAGSLDETSAGAYCLGPGQSIAVFLHSPAPARLRWAPIQSSDPAVLKAQSSGVLTAPLGVTPGIFRGLVAGTATLSSSAPDGHAWSVTVVVR
jgi:hypothetical protein